VLGEQVELREVRSHRVHVLNPGVDALLDASLAGRDVRSDLAGYWGHEDLDQAEEVCLAIISAHRDRVEGKAGLLRDPERAAGRVRGLMAGAGVAG